MSKSTQEIKAPEKNSLEMNHEKNNWISAFNTSILTTRAKNIKAQPQELSALIHSTEFDSLIFAAQHLAHKEGVSQEEASERLIELFRNIDHSWNQIIIERGISAITKS